MGNFASAAVDFCASFAKASSSGNGGTVSHPTTVVINGATYNIVRLIGEGGYAYVYLAKVPSAMNKQVALKRFVIHEPEQQELFIEESKIHRNICPHDNIVTFLDSEVKHRKNTPLPEVWVSMEYCHGKSLQALVNEYRMKNRVLPLRELKSAARAVLNALAHMHSQSPPVAHFDVKLDNVLQCLDEAVPGRKKKDDDDDASATDMLYKLCDFGSCSKLFYTCRNAQEVTIAEVELGQKMTLLYRSPESLDLWRKQRVDTKADVWALGVLLYVTIFMDYPFDEQATSIIKGVPKAAESSQSAHGASQSSSPQLNRPAAQVQSPFPTSRAQVSEHLKPLADVVFDDMLVVDPAQRSDIFSVAEKLAAFLSFSPPSRPRPGLTSAPKPRFP